MYYEPRRKELRTDAHEVIKTLHCPYQRQELRLTYHNKQSLNCSACHHPVLLAHLHTEPELQRLLSENPQTCLAVDPRRIAMRDT